MPKAPAPSRQPAPRGGDQPAPRDMDQSLHHAAASNEELLQQRADDIASTSAARAAFRQPSGPWFDVNASRSASEYSASGVAFSTAWDNLTNRSPPPASSCDGLSEVTSSYVALSHVGVRPAPSGQHSNASEASW